LKGKKNMPIWLNVPYVEKERAKRAGARWSPSEKRWYVPEGVLLTPLERWLPGLVGSDKAKKAERAKKAPRPRVNERAGKVTTGERYFILEHDCCPFEECAECRPKLVAAGWLNP
jgi:hypothetical protein